MSAGEALCLQTPGRAWGALKLQQGSSAIWKVRAGEAFDWQNIKA